MADKDWTDVFVSGFVVIALAFMTISAWIKVSKAVSVKLYGESDPNDPSLLPYVVAAVVLTVFSLFLIFYIQKFTNINLNRPNTHLMSH
jgi:hypothetical protein